ncbi:MAG TPA: phosphatase PAP2 family protein [Labilithrix sp.]|nr:phosphatase PAP2 family protein [Labilithrix sp.]
MRQLSYDARIDGAVTATGALWFIASEMMKADLVPEKCRWCYRGADGASTLNVVDRNVRRALKWNDERSADLASSFVAFALMPATALALPAGAAAHDNALGGAPVDALLTAQATILAANLNQLVKFAFARERPFVHYLPRTAEGVRALTASPSDDNLSFYSGHTNLAFALATSSGTVSLMRGYRLAPLVLGVGLASAFSVGYLRIAADKHYLSDVTVGAVLGSLVGVLVPLIFHAPSSGRSESAPAQSAQPLQAPFVFDGVW